MQSHQNEHKTTSEHQWDTCKDAKPAQWGADYVKTSQWVAVKHMEQFGAMQVSSSGTPGMIQVTLVIGSGTTKKMWTNIS